MDGVAKYKNEFKYLKKSDLLAKDKLLSALFLGPDYVFFIYSLRFSIKRETDKNKIEGTPILNTVN